MKTPTTETDTCDRCGSECDREQEGYWAEGYDNVCRECYDGIVSTCQICGDEDVMPSKVSGFILVKNEFATTARRPPGIYRILRRPFMTICLVGTDWLHHYDVRFADKLPKPDEEFEISGHICKKCALPYAKAYRKNYGIHALADGFDAPAWEREKEVTRRTILANPDMMRDLECEPDDEDWREIKRTYEIPIDPPTYHEWVFVEHQGVKVFYAGYKSPDSWMTWHAGPEFRSNGHGKDTFHPTGLPNFKKHRDAYVTPIARSLQQQAIRLGWDNDYEIKGWRARQKEDGIENPDDLDYYRDRVSHYDSDKAAAKPATIEAIELGYIRQDGVFDEESNPAHYR